ncbi:MAG: hypothetical protein HC897_04120 [Thermoanaerobaculia bacterium]|nr:hypothetical protein [Thermoanaerobaculia bacterium]
MIQTIELRLEEHVLDRARRLAQARRCKIEDVFEVAIESLPVIEPQTDVFLGMLRDEPELGDQVTELAMVARERDPLRTASG